MAAGLGAQCHTPFTANPNFPFHNIIHAGFAHSSREGAKRAKACRTILRVPDVFAVKSALTA